MTPESLERGGELHRLIVRLDLQLAELESEDPRDRLRRGEVTEYSVTQATKEAMRRMAIEDIRGVLDAARKEFASL